jgi:streptogramin lyase
VVSMDKWRMKDEGEVVEWFPAPKGNGHIGIIKGDDGGVYTVHSDDCIDLAKISKGKRVRYAIETFRNDDGERIVGTDMETGTQYGAGVAREIEST